MERWHVPAVRTGLARQVSTRRPRPLPFWTAFRIPPHRTWHCHRAVRSVGGASMGQDPRLLWMGTERDYPKASAEVCSSFDGGPGTCWPTRTCSRQPQGGHGRGNMFHPTMGEVEPLSNGQSSKLTGRSLGLRAWRGPDKRVTLGRRDPATNPSLRDKPEEPCGTSGHRDWKSAAFRPLSSADSIVFFSPLKSRWPMFQLG
jgi:hypothetical protein